MHTRIEHALVLSLLVGFCLNCPLGAQTFEYSIEAPHYTTGEPGSSITYEALCFLESRDVPGSLGAEAWTVAIAIENGSISNATTDRTAGDIPPDGYRTRFSSFELTRITTGPGNEGVISAVLLSLDDAAVTLPPLGRLPILRIVANVEVPPPVVEPTGLEECSPLEARLSFQDGLFGEGEPVRNVVTYGGLSYSALVASEDATTTVCPNLDNPATFRIDVLEQEAVREFFTGDRFHWSLAVAPGLPSTDVDLGVRLVSRLGDFGVQGWSVSVETDPHAEIIEATVRDTAGDVSSLGMDGFEQTEIVDPGENGGRHGVVSAVILCLSECDTTLPPEGEELILRLRTRLDTSTILGESDATGPFSIQPTETAEPGLTGSGQPVRTVVAVDGATIVTDAVGAELHLVGSERPTPFLRGEANNDDDIDIADAIYLLNYLFQRGPPLACRKAGDSNDDGSLDLSDPIHLLLFQFNGGLPPPGPYPSCGTDPTPDDLTCEEQLTSCGP